jgi:protein-L-isoaspartate(D-aspartate) O-methyltransferase
VGVIGIVLIAVGGTAIGLRLHAPQGGSSALQKAPPPQDPLQRPSDEESRFVEARRRMVEEQLRGRDITDPKVLKVMGRVARQRFVPKDVQHLAYADQALPIDQHQTISQPYIVALMTQTARPTSQSRALEIGTGSGYQAAVLAEVCKEVYSIEILKPLADSARERLTALGYKNVTIRHGDGYQGWREHAPFDVILVTAAPDHVPQALVEQLAVGGRMVIPIGCYFQELLLLEKRQDGTVCRKAIAPVMFVPMTGEAQKQPKQ